jgi:hypothetical protein
MQGETDCVHTVDLFALFGSEPLICGFSSVAVYGILNIKRSLLDE